MRESILLFPRISREAGIYSYVLCRAAHGGAGAGALSCWDQERNTLHRNNKTRPKKSKLYTEDTTLDLKQEVCAYSTASKEHVPTLLVVFVFFSTVLKLPSAAPVILY
ncbi:hypothetical protein E2320_009865 [Naja naja]|nr:hypothetical protein E2320_009865 [Naja naja]